MGWNAILPGSRRCNSLLPASASPASSSGKQPQVDSKDELLKSPKGCGGTPKQAKRCKRHHRPTVSNIVQSSFAWAAQGDRCSAKARCDSTRQRFACPKIPKGCFDGTAYAILTATCRVALMDTVQHRLESSCFIWRAMILEGHGPTPPMASTYCSAVARLFQHIPTWMRRCLTWPKLFKILAAAWNPKESGGGNQHRTAPGLHMNSPSKENTYLLRIFSWWLAGGVGSISNN